jgi:hypothetical protein
MVYYGKYIGIDIKIDSTYILWHQIISQIKGEDYDGPHNCPECTQL